MTGSALTLLVGWQEGHPACKKTEWWGAGMVICMDRGADLHTAQLMPLPLTVSCFSKIQIGFTFLVPAYSGSPGKRAVKRVCVCNDWHNITSRLQKCSRFHQPQVVGQGDVLPQLPVCFHVHLCNTVRPATMQRSPQFSYKLLSSFTATTLRTTSANVE